MKKVVNSCITACIVLILLLAGIMQKGNRQEVDVILFAGQSNMSGIGEADKAPVVPEGWGYEFRAISDPSRLYPLAEPFGEHENNPGMCDDSDLLDRTGSLVSAFVNAYYEETGVPVVAISASRGSSKMNTWLKENGLFMDAGKRLDDCLKFLSHSSEYKVRHVYMVWLQGESDAEGTMTAGLYQEQLTQLFDNFHIMGIEKCFLIRIGYDLERSKHSIDKIIEAQTQLCSDSEDFILVSVQAITLEEKGMMQDRVHYSQEGYNLIGEEAGKNAGIYTNSGKEPSFFDPYTQETYIPD